MNATDNVLFKYTNGFYNGTDNCGISIDFDASFAGSNDTTIECLTSSYIMSAKAQKFRFRWLTLQNTDTVLVGDIRFTDTVFDESSLLGFCLRGSCRDIFA